MKLLCDLDAVSRCASECQQVPAFSVVSPWSAIVQNKTSGQTLAIKHFPQRD